MKTTGKKKGQKKPRRKGGTGKGFFIAILIGIGLSLLFLYRQDISDLLSSRPVRRTVVKHKEIEKSKDKSKTRDKNTDKRNVILYFSDGQEEFLVGERIGIDQRNTVEEEAKELVNELIKGPKGKLVPTLPPRTKLLALNVDENGVARVDFSRDLSMSHPGGSSAEIMTVYSVVNSLSVNFPEIKGVQILIEGKEIETIAGHLSLKRPLSSKPDLIKKN